MYVTKDCVPGSLGGVYSGVTVAATMVYAECKNADCGYDWFAIPWVDGATWDFQYNITSASYGLSGIAGALVRQATENTLGNLWEAASNQFIGAFVCVLLGIGACVFMPGSSGSDSPGTELMSLKSDIPFLSARINFWLLKQRRTGRQPSVRATEFVPHLDEKAGIVTAAHQ